VFQASRPKGKLSKASQDKLLRSAKFSKPPSGAGVGKKWTANESDFIVDDTELPQHPETAWNLSAGKAFSEDNDNNGI